MTLATVRRKTERIRELSALPFLLVAAVSLAGALFRPAPQRVTGGPVNTGDVAWMLTATGLVLLMTPGLSFFYGGMVRTKNVVSTMLQSFVAMAVISILWVVVGFSLAFGDSVHGLIGNPATFFMFTRVGTATQTSEVDDTLDVFPCHGVGGMVGMLLTGVFAKDVGLMSGHAYTFLVHCGALVFVAAFSFAGSWALYKVTDLIIPLRVSEEQEEIGLDLSQHGEVMEEGVALPFVLANTA